MIIQAQRCTPDKVLFRNNAARYGSQYYRTFLNLVSNKCSDNSQNTNVVRYYLVESAQAIELSIVKM